MNCPARANAMACRAPQGAREGAAEPIRIPLTANATYLITVKRKETGK